MKMNFQSLLAFMTVWLLFAGLLSLAIIFDDIYVQVLFDFGIIIITTIITYYTARKSPKQE